MSENKINKFEFSLKTKLRFGAEEGLNLGKYLIYCFFIKIYYYTYDTNLL